ncbi:DUF2316 family protein [Glutamicibacter sp. BSL13]|jgi:hypothetical protein
MSLNIFQRRAVTKTLLSDLDRSGLTRDEVAADLRITTDQLDLAIRMARGGDPTHVWLVRDYLHQAVIDSGGEPTEHTVLTEASRAKARQWFTMTTPPRHDFSAVTARGEAR